jgi:hypothetical protein
MLDIEDFFLNLDAEILIFLNSIHINIFDQIMWAEFKRIMQPHCNPN